MPRDLMEKEMDDMISEIRSDLITEFIIPFSCFSLFATIIIIIVLNKVGVYLTNPIINLFSNISSVM